MAKKKQRAIGKRKSHRNGRLRHQNKTKQRRQQKKWRQLTTSRNGPSTRRNKESAIFFSKKKGEPNNETYDPRPSSMTRRTPNRKINKWGKPAGKEKDTAIRIWRNRIKRERERRKSPNRRPKEKVRLSGNPKRKGFGFISSALSLFFLVINRWWKDKKTQSRME